MSTHLVGETFLATFHKLGLHILPERSSKRCYRSCKVWVRKDSWRHIQDISFGSHASTQQFNTKDAFVTGGKLDVGHCLVSSCDKGSCDKGS